MGRRARRRLSRSCDPQLVPPASGRCVWRSGRRRRVAAVAAAVAAAPALGAVLGVDRVEVVRRIEAVDGPRARRTEPYGQVAFLGRLPLTGRLASHGEEALTEIAGHRVRRGVVHVVLHARESFTRDAPCQAFSSRDFYLGISGVRRIAGRGWANLPWRVE